jgi:hypothetical protein
MHNWFECKVRYEKLDENGLPKKVTEPYLVDALSFTEAEARISKEMQPFISGEFTIANIKRANIAELIESPSGDRWYRCRVAFTIVDMDKGTEKKVTSNIYVQASEIKEALDNLDKGMQGTLSDYSVTSIAETMILDIYPYVPAAEEKNATQIEQPDMAYSVYVKEEIENEAEQRNEYLSEEINN